MMICGGKCSRCGTEESMFWYPYAFGVAPIPSVADHNINRAQYFNLCDRCQQEFTEFMQNTDYPFLSAEKLKELIDRKPVIIPTAEDYQ